MMVFPETCDAP